MAEISLVAVINLASVLVVNNATVAAINVAVIANVTVAAVSDIYVAAFVAAVAVNNVAAVTLMTYQLATRVRSMKENKKKSVLKVELDFELKSPSRGIYLLVRCHTFLQDTFGQSIKSS